MDLLKGPKGLLSSAIADALAEYFVVGVDHIESNLLTDTKIVLKDLRLKPQHSSIAKNTSGKTTDISVTGFVREISFTWSWDFLGSESEAWTKDAVLEIKGCKFKVRLSQGDATNDGGDSGDTIPHANIDSGNTSLEQHQESISEPQSKVDEETAQTNTIADGIDAFLTKQKELLVNALALTIIDFEVIVEMPSPTIVATSTKVIEDPEVAGNIEVVQVEASTSSSKSEAFAKGSNNDYTVSLKFGGRELNIHSNGRCSSDSEETLKEQISFSSLFMNVTETFHFSGDTTTSDSTQRRRVVCKTYPLLEPFSYTLGLTRTYGTRFSDYGRGLIVKGEHHLEFDGDTTIVTSKKRDGGLKVHLSRPQMEAIGQLSGLVLAPREETIKKEILAGTTKISSNDDKTTLEGGISMFDISLDSVTAAMMGNMLSATGIKFGCLADGTDLSAKAESFRFIEGPSKAKRLGTSVTFSNIVASVHPCIEVAIGSVSELYVPDIVELRTPMKNVRVRLVGETWTVDIDSFDGYLQEPEAGYLSIPFPIICKVKRICLVKDEDKDTEVAFADVEILINPKTDKSGTDLACTIRSMKSKLASANCINTCMVFPAVGQDTDMIRNFALSLESISVTAGYTIQDWKNTFRIIGNRRRKRKSEIDDTTYFKLPYASVAPLKTRITYNALRVVSLKETTFRVKAFKGNKSTTAKDLLDFYTAQFLARTKDFLQNAELLGINVNKAGAFSLATIGFATPIAPFVGVAAVVGVDAVRGSIEAGKRSRRAEEGEAARAGDFFRGIGYSAVEATRKGRLRRGAQEGEGNVVDWMVGATVNTGDYIGKNKDTLGSAGGAGAGILVGTILGGPVGAVIGGVLGGMTTGTAIRRIDKRIKRVMEKRESKYEDSKLKNGQLALSPS
jgi:hypothetical protein